MSCENVGKSYGDVEVFNDLKFVVERENKIGLVGINGAGKSTLLKMLAGVEKPSTWYVRIRTEYKSILLRTTSIRDSRRKRYSI